MSYWESNTILQKINKTHTLGDKSFNSEIKYLFYQCLKEYVQYIKYILKNIFIETNIKYFHSFF